MLGKPRQPLKTTKMKRKENENCVCALSIFTPSRIEVRHFFALKETSANQFVIALYRKWEKEFWKIFVYAKILVASVYMTLSWP